MGTLKGCDRAVSQAFSLEDKCNREPGAMPRAMLSQPFGLKKEWFIGSRGNTGLRGGIARGEAE
jgi:hypothetical protein